MVPLGNVELCSGVAQYGEMQFRLGIAPFRLVYHRFDKEIYPGLFAPDYFFFTFLPK